jgi:hypothetical protein
MSAGPGCIVHTMYCAYEIQKFHPYVCGICSLTFVWPAGWSVSFLPEVDFWSILHCNSACLGLRATGGERKVLCFVNLTLQHWSLFLLTFTGNAPHFKLQATKNLVKYWSYFECLNVVNSHYHISTCNSTVWFQFYKDKFLNAHTIASMNLPYIVVPYLAITIQTSFTTSKVNMVAPITTSTKEEQGAAIWFLWTEINQRLWAQ